MFDRDRNQPNRYGAPVPVQPGSGRAYDQGVGGVRTGVAVREGYLTQSFVWMFVALLVSAGAAWAGLANERALAFVIDNYFMLAIVQLGVVIGLQVIINRISAVVGLGLLFVYAILTGATLAIIALAYTPASIATAFLGASAVFGAAALYGVVTKRDLTGLGGFIFVGLIGMIVVSMVNWFIGFEMISFILGVVGVVIFTALTAYEVQRINEGDFGRAGSRDKASVIGALILYVSFIGIFISLLRIFGTGRD
ncbi:Bax inhibitor-1/YccA family protein [soil metagenome]